LRAVLDANVLISALLSRTGAPAQVLLAWLEGRFELIVSPDILTELGRALAYPKLRCLIPQNDAEAFVAWLARSAVLARDPVGPPPIRSVDPGDDYLLSLGRPTRCPGFGRWPPAPAGWRLPDPHAGGLPVASR
jgi:putative PIN family toxin of toxin-antitoxin system